MYALVNTFNAIQGDTIGTVSSLHRSEEAAERANTRLQRRVKMFNGDTSYIPTCIVALRRMVPCGEGVSLHDVAGFEVE